MAQRERDLSQELRMTSRKTIDFIVEHQSFIQSIGKNRGEKVVSIEDVGRSEKHHNISDNIDFKVSYHDDD